MANLSPISILFNVSAVALGHQKPPRRTTLDTLVVEATLEEVHSASAEVTEFPVEVGADVTDHVRPKPKVLVLTGLISDTPLDTSLLRAAISNAPFAFEIANAVDPVEKTALSRSELHFAALQALLDARAPFLVHTPYRDYENMVITDLSSARDRTEALTFRATLREIVLAESQTTTISVPPPPAAPKKSKGRVGKKPAPPAVKDSAAAAATGWGQAPIRPTP